MSDPLFDSRTPRLDMPLLFAGQAQKEGFVNEVTARVDALLHAAIESETETPPISPLDGQAWLVGTSPSGEWSGHGGEIAARQAGNWLFFTPRDGMKLLNRAAGQEIRYQAGWQIAARPTSPSGGTTIDNEARASIDGLIAALTTAGIIPAT